MISLRFPGLQEFGVRSEVLKLGQVELMRSQDCSDIRRVRFNDRVTETEAMGEGYLTISN
jgi:hypothetical protein